MPEKSVQVTDLQFSISIVVGIISLFFSGYVALISKYVGLQIETIKERMKKIEDSLDKHEAEDKKILNESFERVRDLENLTNVMKAEHDKNHGGRK